MVSNDKNKDIDYLSVSAKKLNNEANDKLEVIYSERVYIKGDIEEVDSLKIVLKLSLQNIEIMNFHSNLLWG